MRLFLLLCLLVVGPVVKATVDSTQSVGIDFYHFWLPAQAQALSDAPLGSPYEDGGAAYAAVMNAEADAVWAHHGASPDASSRAARAVAELRTLLARADAATQAELVGLERFLVANARRRTVDLTATPLLYAWCGFLPADYHRAIDVFAALKFVAFLLATAILWRAAGGRWPEGVFLGLIGMQLYLPYRTDLQVGNLGSVHLAFAALPIAVAAGPFARATEVRARARWGGIAIALAAAYVMLKPNFALLAVGLVAHVVLRLGKAGCRRAWPIPLIAIAVLWSWPCLTFGDFSVWNEWLAYIGADSEKLAYDIKKHNVSTPLHLAHWLGGSWPVWAWAVGAALLVTAAVTVLRSPRPGLPAKAAHFARTVLGCPLAASVAGLMITLGTAPLVWTHYMVIGIVPLAWGMRRGRLGWDFWLVFVGLLIYSRTFLPLFSSAGWLKGGPDEVRGWVAVAWVPIWLGLLVWAAGAMRDDAEPASSVTEPAR